MTSASKPLLSYDFGNQAQRSRLEVSPTGVVTHLEFTAGAPKTVKEKKLTAAELRLLKANIEAAKKGPIAKREGGATSMGSSAGDFFVTDKAGKRVTVATVARAEDPVHGGHDALSLNQSAAANAIFDFVVKKTGADIDPAAYDEAKFKKEMGLFNASAPEKTGDFSAASVQSAARAFMKRSGLFGAYPEGTKQGVKTEWAAIKVVKHGDVNLVVMNPQLTVFGATQNGEAFDVLVAEPKAGGQFTFKRFEEAFAVPPTLRVAIGLSKSDTDSQMNPNGKLRTDLYYAELSNVARTATNAPQHSVTDALKSIYARVDYAGLSAKVVKGHTPSFDETPGRDWHLESPTYDLRRGNTAEALDVDPHFFDEDFESTFRGCDGVIAPWGSASVRKVQIDGVYKPVLVKPIDTP